MRQIYQNACLMIVIMILICISGVINTIEAQTPQETYQKKLSGIKENDIEGFYQLGLWCKQNKLPEQAQEQFEKVVKLDTEHQKARKELGHVKYKDQWMLAEEKELRVNQEKGLIQYGEKWVKPAEMESLRQKERDSLKWDFNCKIQTKHYLIYSSTTEEETRYIAKVLECLYETIIEQFKNHFKITAKHPFLKARLYNDNNEFHQQLPQAKNIAEGVYDRNTRILHTCYHRIAKIPYSNALHEGMHQLGFEVLNTIFPKWLDEGLACYFESCIVKDNKLILGDIDSASHPGRWFFEDSEKLGDELGDMKQYIAISGSGWEGQKDEHKVHLQYRTCWLFTHFLFHYNNGSYKEKFLEYISKAKSDRSRKGNIGVFESSIDKIDTLWPRFEEYFNKLKDKKKS